MSESNKVLEELGEKVDRASKQKPEPKKFFTSTYNWIKGMELLEPDWGVYRGDWVDNRKREEWLAGLAREEPHLGSVLSTAVTMDANRQWRLIGGRNQVMRFAKKFQEFDRGNGFRTLQEFNATNYYGSDLGGIVEIETEGKNGPLLSLYHTDPTRLRLGKKGLLKYDTQDIWRPNNYYRLASMKSTQDKYNALGYCALSRCIKLAQTMVAIVTHNLEKLGHIAPKGILFIQAEDLTQETWDEAMEARKAVYITGTGNQYYDEVVTVVDRAAKGELLALSQLPDGFDTFTFTDYMIKAYALAFNRDVRAFWSLNSGNFGGGTEAKLQSEKATYGGAAEFVLASQEQIQWLLPDTLLFEYEVDDTRGKANKAEVDQVLIDSAKGLLEIGLDSAHAQQWLAEKGVIPAEWTEEEEVEVAENGVVKERYLEMEHVRSALDRFPDEPLVMYEPASIDKPSASVVRLWDNRAHAIGKSWHVTRKVGNDRLKIAHVLKKLRQSQIEDFNEEEGTRGNFMYLAGAEAFLEAFLEFDEEEENFDEQQALLDEIQDLLDSGDITNEDVEEINDGLSPLVPAAIIAILLALREDSNAASPDSIELHPMRWNTRLEYLINLGMLHGSEAIALFTWRFGDTKHCRDCAELDGVTLTAAGWLADGRVPQGDMLECGGFHCQCSLIPE